MECNIPVWNGKWNRFHTSQDTLSGLDPGGGGVQGVQTPPFTFQCIDDMCCAFVKSHLIFTVVCVVSCRARALELELGCTS